MPSRMDHISDKNGVELVRLSRLYDFPEFVKTAKMDGRDFDTTGIPTSACADLAHNQFSCHTKASTWLSALYFTEKQAEFHPDDQKRINNRLDHYANYWGIKTAVDQIRTRHAELYKQSEAAIPDSVFAYVWTGDNGRKERRLPLQNTMEVKAAADWLEKYRDGLPFSQRHVIAKKILEKAAKFGAGLGEQLEFLEKQAGRGVCDPREVVQMINNRATLVSNPGLRTQFTKMAETVAKLPSKALQPAMLVKLAETVDQLDRNMGWVGKYAPGLDRPEDVIFKVTFTKVASELTHRVETSTGNIYHAEDFSKLALDDVRALFGDDFAERVQTGIELDPEKLAEEVRTLPRPDAAMFDGLMADSKLNPILTKAASTRQGFNQIEMKAWADAYATAR